MEYESLALNQDELQQFQEIGVRANALHQNIGMATHQKKLLENDIERFVTEVLECDRDQQTLMTRIKAKYQLDDTYRIDLSTGLISKVA